MPSQGTPSNGELSRRSFLQAIAGGAAAPTLALGSSALLSDPDASPHMKAGQWTVLATTCRECPAGCGMHVRCRENRPIKCEGNPEHPVNKGGLCPRGQSAVQGLYDPDRIRTPHYRGDGGSLRATEWSVVEQDIAKAAAKAKRLFVVSELKAGASSEVMQSFCDSVGIPAKLLFYEPIHYTALRKANQKLFAILDIPSYRLDRSGFILNFGADFLEFWVSNVQFTRQFAEMHHRRDDSTGEMGRMAYLGQRFSMTAANADAYHAVPRDRELPIALAILNRLVKINPADANLRQIASMLPKQSENFGGIAPETLDAYCDRLVNAKGILMGGSGVSSDAYSEQLNIALMLANYALGGIGDRIDFSSPHALSKTTLEEQIEEFFRSLHPDDLVIFVNCDPAFTRPWHRAQIEGLNNSIYIGTMMNPTAALCRWVLPCHSPLESWDDYMPQEGIHSLAQPCVHPLYNSRNAGDIFLGLAHLMGKDLARQGRTVGSFLDWLRARWRELAGVQKAGDQEFWHESLQKGFFLQPAQKQDQPKLTLADLSWPQIKESGSGGITLLAWPSIRLFDGRTANRGWMQEMPEPVSTIAWQAYADISTADAQRHNIKQGDLLAIRNGAEEVQLPARVSEDILEGTLAVMLGQGHTMLGQTARLGQGGNAWSLLNAHDSQTISFRPTGYNQPLVQLAATRLQYGRNVLKWTDAKTVEPEPVIWPLPAGYSKEKDLYPPHEYKKHRWAMAIDLDKCIGCGACTAACYAENNIAVMGPQPLVKGRELTWLKVVSYMEENGERLGFLPMLCQHCDAAPCEPVCPVFASVHNEEGLNAQIYNRCIGTRYCSNNCPYKVRRFNWFNTRWRKPLQMQLNPDVDVRCRGVMEKCTFCIQRIKYGEHRAAIENRPVRDGEIQPACAQSCPAGVFVFGDLMDRRSKVFQLFHHQRRYQLLQDLNTKPAIIYLKRLKA